MSRTAMPHTTMMAKTSMESGRTLPSVAEVSEMAAVGAAPFDDDPSDDGSDPEVGAIRTGCSTGILEIS